MKTKTKVVLSLMLSLMLGVSAERMAEASEVEYSVKPILESNQSSEVASYFDVTVTPGSEQNFSLIITNYGDQPQEYQVEPNRGTTNSNGVIDYSVHGVANDSEAEYLFEDLITPSQTVSVKPGEDKQVDFKLAVPEKKFKGMLLGGFVVTPLKKEQSKEQIVNVYTHTIAAVIRESDTKIEPNILLKKVEVGQENKRNALKTTFQNPTPTMINKLTMTMVVNKKGQSESVYETQVEQLNIAPNTTFSLPVLIEKAFEQGDYLINIEMTNAEGNWKFQEEFEIKAEEVKKLNKESIDKKLPQTNESKQFNRWLILLVFILASCLVYQKKAKK